ncbi:MAG: leucyl aminopeptidase family protein [Saprospiraceae bacterium]
MKLYHSLKEISSSNLILVPYIIGEEKKLNKFFSSLHPEKDSTLMNCIQEFIHHHKPDSKKYLDQYFGKQKIILIGLETNFNYLENSLAARLAVYRSKLKSENTAVSIFLPSYLTKKTVSALCNGLALAGMNIDYYKKERNKFSLSLSALTEAKLKHDDAIKEGVELAETQEQICHLVNMPANEKNPKFMADWIQERFDKRNVLVEIIEGEELVHHNLGALIGVGKGSQTPPCLVILKYKPKQKGRTKHIGLVGKGVTFDTGGISLKNPLNMHLMKSDMGGAAAVLGALDIIEKLKLNIQVTAVIPFAENAIGSAAYRPGDILKAYNGKSIEVIDTDAEGRLILADALAYMVAKFKPDHVIDLATLTGSVIMTLGSKAAGLFCNDDKLIKNLLKAGDATGEKLWPLPIWKDYEDEMSSDIADIKNLSTKPVAGAITAAKFLQAFINDHPSWAHIDIAGMAMTENDFSKFRSATSYGVLLLKQFVSELAKSK